jgi:hypothetical protein
MFYGFIFKNATGSASTIGLTGAATGSLTIKECVFSDVGSTTIRNYINCAGSHKLYIDRTLMYNSSQNINSPLIFCSGTTATITQSDFTTARTQPIIQITGSSNPLMLTTTNLTCTSVTSSALGVIYLSNVLPTGPTGTYNTIANCEISSVAPATSSSAGGTPAVALDATGSRLIFSYNICQTRYWSGGSSIANAVENSGAGATGSTTTYYSSNYVPITNYAYGIIGSGNFVKTASTLIS